MMGDISIERTTTEKKWSREEAKAKEALALHINHQAIQASEATVRTEARIVSHTGPSAGTGPYIMLRDSVGSGAAQERDPMLGKPRETNARTRERVTGASLTRDSHTSHLKTRHNL
ncbi:hypothetical protein KQX54_005332 [Cotesia glomerata]|uniref:Uncharacterized protein n=1 Tax=Cotesia glomerata TaxID=32391 RepID=A0AAV7J6U6_COTGL|nr:hypothetical protein KQX54_005332 [Cotesia glomerata]